ncbi:hypothetical protein M8C21_020069, partial [Ambrosia artemisiifolia]
HLPHLKVLVLRYMKNLLSTPDFDGLPCLQKLTLFDCEELQRIHPSLGKHKSLEYVNVSDCRNLQMFPTIVNMGKLNTLDIRYCHKGLQFPEIKSNMESLVKLNLANMRIDVLLLSIGDQCPNLISLELIDCSYLRNKEINFYGLKHLEMFKVHVPNHLKMLDHISISWLIGKVACGRDWHRIQVSNFLLWLVFPQLTHSLRKLDLSGCHLKDGEIPSDIGELSNLQELNLSCNNFTRLDFSLSQLTRLKILTLNSCKRLVELSKLPSSIFILLADFCESLTTVGDFYTNCKWLCQVSLVRGGIVTNGRRLLPSMQAMLEGNAIKNHSMLLKLEGHEIAKEFKPPLVSGRTYEISHYSQRISMEHVLSGMDYEDDVAWEESDNDKRTLVWYVSFASLRHTTWWSSTYKAVLFSLGLEAAIQSFSGFGVALVARKSGSGPTEASTTQQEYEFSHYTPSFNIVQDVQYALKIEFPSKYKADNELLYEV